MSFQQLKIIISSRIWLTLLVLMLTVISCITVSLLLPKQYIATASVVVDQRSVDPVTGQIVPVQLMPSYIATQVDIIASHNVALKVLESLPNESKLSEEPNKIDNGNLVINVLKKLTPSVLKLSESMQIQQDIARADNIGEISDWAADLLLKKLEVRPSRESNLIQIEYTSTDPKVASDLANAFAEAYIKTSIELRAQPAKLTADWFGSQMSSLRENLEHAQLVLSTYQQQEGIVEGAERMNVDRLVDIEQTRLVDLSKQLVESQSHTNELQSRKDLLASTQKNGGSLESLQEVLNSPLIQSLKSELAKSTARLEGLSQKFDTGNNTYKEAVAQVNSLQKQINSATKMVLNNIESAVVSSKSQDNMLTKALVEQKAKLMNLKKKHDQIAVFQREVENAQKAYDEVMHRAVQTRMESEVSQTDISILNPAFPPRKPASPNLLKNFILSFFVGSVLGLGLTLFVELLDRRVRSAFDISEMLSIPVFAEMSTTATESKQIL